jgi:hypothetical protein
MVEVGVIIAPRMGVVVVVMVATQNPPHPLLALQVRERR